MPICRWAAVALLALLPSWALASGALEYVGSTPTGCASAPLPGGTFAGRVVSPEGDLYEIRSEGTARWRRNPATGALTVEIQGLSDPRLVATSPDPYQHSLRQAAFTPDGRYVVLGLPGEQSGNARIVVVERDVATGVLTAVAQEIADTGVQGPDALVVAPDGRHVYLAGYAGGRGIQAFERNLTTGVLTALGSTVPPESNGGVYRGLVASGDGLHLYGLAWDPGSQADWAHCSDDSILLEAWGRNPVTGALSLLQAYTVLQSCGVDQREWNMPVISSDGADVYVMSPFGLVHQFRRAPATGLLTRAGAAGLPGPYYPDLNSYNWRLVIRPDGGFLYVERGEVLARDPATGALTYAGTIPDFYTPIGFAGDGDLITEGPRVYRLAGPTGFGPVTDDDSPSDIVGTMALSPDGAHMYVHCLAEDAVAWFAVDQDLGVVTPAGKFVDGGGDPPPRSSLHENPPPLVVSPDGRHVYAGSLHGDGIATLARDAATGALTFAGAVRQGEAGIDGLRRLSHVALSADGTSLYAAAYAPDVYGESPRLSVFARDAGSGALTQLQALAEWTYVYWLGASLAIPEDGAQVYFYGGSRSDVPPVSSVLRRDPATGRLDPGQALKLNGWPTFGPGGIHYYVADSPPFVRKRDPVTGALSAVQSLPGTCWAGPLTVGGGGEYAHTSRCKYAYGFSLVGAGITTLRRDPVSGMLGEVQQLAEGPVLGPLVSTSRDGRQVWGVSPWDNVIAHYRRREPCAPAPLAGCRVPTRPGAASLNLSEGTGTRDQLKLRWTRGGAVTRTELGEPDVSTEYAACVYDAAGPQPVTSLLVPAGGTCRDEPCWQWRAQGFTYRNRERTPDGVALVAMKPGGDGETSLRWQANKGAVPPLGLPLDAPVVVQIQASNGTCWEARFSDLRVNDGGKLVARSD